MMIRTEGRIAQETRRGGMPENITATVSTHINSREELGLAAVPSTPVGGWAPRVADTGCDNRCRGGKRGRAVIMNDEARDARAQAGERETRSTDAQRVWISQDDGRRQAQVWQKM